MIDTPKIPKPVVTITDEERANKYLRVVSIGYEKIAAYWRANSPDLKKRPITSALVAVYVARLEIQTSAAGGGLHSLRAARENHPALYSDLQELGSWLEPLEPAHLNPKVTENNEGVLGDLLVSYLGFSYSEARTLLRKQGQPPKGAPNKRALTLAMLDARIVNGWSYAKLASKMCECPLKTHNDLCRERIRKRIKELETVLSKYEIQYRKKRRK
jgi:hypothetical protein